MNGETKTDSSTRSTQLQLVIVFLIALSMRAAFLERAAIEHFDEGVYASNLFFGEAEGSEYPLRHLYAPPLVPTLIETSITMLGPTTLGYLLPSLIAGTLTVVLVWHVARKWFGDEAGLPTAIIAAFSDFHIVFSRAALTDVWLGFFTLLAVYLGTESVRNRSIKTAVFAGMATGLGWWCKYNGWLAIAITITSTVIWILWHRRAASPAKSIVCCVVMALVGGAVWCPVVFGLEDVGGYSAVASNHRNYVVGLTGWLDSAKQQLGSHRVLDSWISWCSLGIAALLSIGHQLWPSSFTWNQKRDDFSISIALIGKLIAGSALLSLLAACGVGTTVVLFFAALGGLAGRLRWPCIPIESVEATDQQQLARWTLPCWSVVVWLGSLTVATPMYRAYPRLSLPWLIAVWLGAGAGISWWVRANLRYHGRKEPVHSVGMHNLTLVLLVGLAMFVVFRNGRFTEPAGWQPRTSMHKLAIAIGDEFRARGSESVVYTFAEPAVFFHLNANGVLAKPVTSLPSGGASFLLLEGPHARRTAEFMDAWAASGHRYQLVKSFEITSSDQVLLNEHAARDVERGNVEPESFHVWRLRK